MVFRAFPATACLCALFATIVGTKCSTTPNLRGYQWLRHIGLANVSYLVPAGKGLTIQAGIFSSFIGYDSLYTKDNFSYTRPWGADFTPYLMMGVNAGYPVTENLTGSL